MGYTAQVFGHIDEVNRDDWQFVHCQVGDACCDLRYLKVAEETIGDVAPCRPVIFYDESGNPVGITTISACRLDVAQMAPPWARKVVDWIRRVWPGYLQLNTVMCGPAATILQEKLYLLDGVDREEILVLLDRLLCQFAHERRASLIMMGDFDASKRNWLDSLQQLGYVAGDSHPTYRLELPFSDFDDYLACMRSDPRCQITSDRRRLESANVTVDHYAGGESAAEAFTKQHHKFYLDLLERVDNSMVTLPLEFFQGMLRELSGIVHFCDIRIDGEPVAFGLDLGWNDRFELLFVGYDPPSNAANALYFNTFHEAIKWALDEGCTSLELGATGDIFKMRLGAVPRERTIYVKAPGLLRYPLRWFSSLVLPPHELPSPRNIFVREPASQGKSQPATSFSTASQS